MQLWLRIGAVHNTKFSVGILLLHTDSPDAYQRDQSSTLLKQKISWRYPAASFCENVENDSFSNDNKTTISNHCSSLHHLLLLLLHLLVDLLHRRDWRADLEQQECWRPPEKLVEKQSFSEKGWVDSTPNDVLLYCEEITFLLFKKKWCRRKDWERAFGWQPRELALWPRGRHILGQHCWVERSGREELLIV